MIKLTGTTYGDHYGPAMKITDQAEADDYFEQLVASQMRRGTSRAEAERIERSNLGYYAGYYNDETSARVLTLFGAAHPIFGTHTPTAGEALAAGQRAAAKDGIE